MDHSKLPVTTRISNQDECFPYSFLQSLGKWLSTTHPSSWSFPNPFSEGKENDHWSLHPQAEIIQPWYVKPSVLDCFTLTQNIDVPMAPLDFNQYFFNPVWFVFYS